MGPDHVFNFVNDGYVEVVGRDRNQLLGKAVREVFPEFVEQGITKLLDRVYQSSKAYTVAACEVNISRQGCEEISYFDFSYFPMRNITGAVEGILCYGADVTRAVRANAELEARVREQTLELEELHEHLRTLNHDLMRVQDEERRRLGLELHDSAGQLLAALKWKLDPLQRELGAQRPDLRKLAQDALHLLSELCQELRTVSHLLHPRLLEEAGLAIALRAYVEGLKERGGLSVTLEIDPDLERLSQETELTIFRTVQESLTNIFRHAKTKRAEVRILYNSRLVKVQILDRGRGIPGFTSLKDPNVKLGVGILGMQERIRQLNGQLDVESGAGGTIVTAVLPINCVNEDSVLAPRKCA
jgi:signal transduction histidine kinase